MSTESAISIRREHLHRRGIRLEWFTVSWNVVEAFVAIGAGLIASSTALIAFGVDSLIEVISAVVLLWRLLQTGPNATVEEHGHAERRALYLVLATFFLLAAFVTFESISALVTREAPDSSTVGLVLSLLSLNHYAGACLYQAADRARVGQQGVVGRCGRDMGVLLPILHAARRRGAVLMMMFPS